MNKIKVYFATRLRGFFRQLINYNHKNIDFLFRESTVYETNSSWNKLKNWIGRSYLLDLFGVIQVIRENKKDVNVIGSFNRFLHTDKPYFIYVENPTALFHYKLYRGESFFGRKLIDKELHNSSLKGVIFMSDACARTFEQVCGKLSPACLRKTIYPLIPINPQVSKESIATRCHVSELRLLYIAQGIRFESKGGLEIIKAFTELIDEGYNLKLQIITSLSDLSSLSKEAIANNRFLNVSDFGFSFEEMQYIYANSHVLLQPTSDDSFGLTILEAIKSGLPVIASKLYSIPELIKDGWNGFLCEPHYCFFDENCMPNPSVWNHRKDTIYSGKISIDIVKFIKEKIILLYKNRDLLEEMSINSFNRAINPPFSERFVADQWDEFITFITH